MVVCNGGCNGAAFFDCDQSPLAILSSHASDRQYCTPTRSIEHERRRRPYYAMASPAEPSGQVAITVNQILVFFGTNTMWRAFFCAIGTMLVILGVESLMIDSATLTQGPPEEQTIANAWGATQTVLVGGSSKTVKPPEWIPWSFLASGAIILLYAFTLPKKLAGGEG